MLKRAVPEQQRKGIKNGKQFSLIISMTLTTVLVNQLDLVLYI